MNKLEAIICLQICAVERGVCMPKSDKYRLLYVLKYLSDHTDENHTVSLSDIIEFLKMHGMDPNRRTVDEDIKALVELGYNIVSYRSTQNRYFLADITFELPELKLLIDAVQAAKFIPSSITDALIENVTSLASEAQAAELRRNLYVNKQKEENKRLLITIDQKNQAINQNRQITF